MQAFNGSKLALLLADQVLVYRRDDKAGIPFPDHWDLPGGGREGDEDPAQCALRELEEEFALRLAPERLVWQQRYDGVRPQALPSYFLVGDLTAAEVQAIRFGDEGQYWTLMAIDDFLDHPDAVPYLKARLRDYLAQRGSAEDRG